MLCASLLFAPLVAAKAGALFTYNVWPSAGALVDLGGGDIPGTGQSAGTCTGAAAASYTFTEGAACVSGANHALGAGNPLIGTSFIGIKVAPADWTATPYWLCAALTQAHCDSEMAGLSATTTPTVQGAPVSAVTGQVGAGCAPVDSTGSCSWNSAARTTYAGVLPSPPSAPPLPVDDDPCFASAATVTKADGRTIRLDALKDGDEIVAATADGALTTDTVAMLLSISKPEAEATFITMTTNDGSALNLTAEHHLPVGAACCSTLKKAADVVVGDRVWVAAAGAAVAASQEVARLTKTVAKGLHSPVLAHGSFPVVNGIVTSFDSIGKVTLASYGLPAALKACRTTDTCGMLRYALLGK